MEIIKSIEEVEGVELEDGDQWGPSTYDGYKVVTSERELFIVVNDFQGCCESWGMVSSEDDTQSFVGAELLQMNWVDVARKKHFDVDVYDGEVMFIDLETSKGLLQLAVYNCHNGYYGHTAFIKIGNDVVMSDCI